MTSNKLLGIILAAFVFLFIVEVFGPLLYLALVAAAIYVLYQAHKENKNNGV